jgi:putative tricarboxylic transport membrane protein
VTAAKPLTRSGRRPDWAALVTAALLIGLAIAVARDAAAISSGAAIYSRIGPRVFPFAIAAVLAALGLATAASAFRHAPVDRERVEFGPVLWVVGGLLVQIALISFAGFSLATGAVFAATARAFGRGPLTLSYPLGVAFALAVWLVFAMALNLILPAGPLERFAMEQLRTLFDLLRSWA